MNPEVISWWRSKQRGYEGEDCRAGACGPGPRGRRHARDGRWHAAPREGGDAFGVRRPLRFLTYKLDLDEKQAARIARVIDELKTERAQAAVDDRRTLSAFADAVAGSTFERARAGEAADRRVDSAKRLRDQVVKALEEIHGVLDDEQRETLAYLLRTGAIVI